MWLSELSTEMKETLKHLLYECVSAGKKGEVDPSHYPSQVYTYTHTHTHFIQCVFNFTFVETLEQVVCSFHGSLSQVIASLSSEARQ